MPGATSPAAPIEVPRAGRWPLFGAAAALFAIGSLTFAVVTSPAERDMGDLQKILYVHVPAAWLMSVSCMIVLWYSVLYLWRRNEKHDLLAASAAEVAATLNGLTLVLGMLWARPTWGVWWTWDARLTSTLALFLVLCGYLALRAFVDDTERRATWSAAVGILGGLNAYIVYMSVRWWRTIHQLQSTPETLDSIYTFGLRLNAFAFLFLTIYFIRRRYEAALLERATEQAVQAAALGRS